MTRPSLHLDDAAGPPSTIAPTRPDEPGVPFPPIAEDAFDPELAAIAEDRVRAPRRFVFFCRLLAIAASAALVFALRWDLRYAVSSRTPIELPSAPSEATLAGAEHHLVVMHGVPGAIGAVEYRRPLGDDMHRLAPLVDQPNIYVELALPRGLSPARFVPPTLLRGRLVPIDETGARFNGARNLISNASGKPPPARAWVLELGAEPSFSAPGALIGLVALVLGLSQIAMVVAPRRAPRRAAASG